MLMSGMIERNVMLQCMFLSLMNKINDRCYFSVSDTAGKLRKRKSEFSLQESKLCSSIKVWMLYQ